MKVIKQIFIILLFYVLGEIVSYLIRVPFPKLYIPGTIIGMLLFLITLMTNKISIKQVDEVGSFLTGNMAFFFIPAAVSVMEYLSILKSAFFKIIILIVISAIVSFFVIAYTVKLTIKIQSKFNKGEIHE